MILRSGVTALTFATSPARTTSARSPPTVNPWRSSRKEASDEAHRTGNWDRHRDRCDADGGRRRRREPPVATRPVRARPRLGLAAGPALRAGPGRAVRVRFLFEVGARRGIGGTDIAHPAPARRRAIVTAPASEVAGEERGCHCPSPFVYK